MSHLKLYRSDIKLLLGFAVSLPVIGLISGIYIGASLESPAENKRRVSVEPVSETIASVPSGIKLESKDTVETATHHSASVSLASNPADEVLSEISSEPPLSNELADVQATPNEDKKREFNRSYPAAQELQGYLIQAGRFSTEENARHYRDKLKAKNVLAQIVVEEQSKIKTVEKDNYLVILAAFDSEEDAKSYSSLAESLYEIDLYVKKQPLNKSQSGPLKAIVSL